MKKLTVLAGMAMAVVSMSPTAHELTLKVDKIKSADGNLLVAVYDQAAHYDSNSKWVVARKIKMTEGPLLIPLGDVPAGYYAVKLFQDENDNGQIDTNLLGIPSEPYGFSNNVDSFSAPSFDEAKVNVDKTTEINIHLR